MLGTSGTHRLTQEAVNAFAEATGNHQLSTVTISVVGAAKPACVVTSVTRQLV